MSGRTKIFVSAYACEPGLGSEIGVGWHWVLEMSRHFDLWVLTRESNRHTIEPWINEHPEFAGIHFLYFDLPKWARFWKKGLRGVRTYYNIWTTLTNRIVRRTMRDNDIRIFHHLTYGNVVWRVSKYGQTQTFVWGPVGGLETIDKDFSRHYSRRERLVEGIRRMLVKKTAHGRGFKCRCRNADLILCKTDITRQLIPEKYRDKAILMTDVATDTLAIAPDTPRADGGVTEYITVGRLDAWRGFDLCIEAMAQAVANGADIHLTIVGKGADKERLVSLVDRLGMQDRVTFAGSVPMQEYQRLMAHADVVVNASLKEGAVTVSFDSMAMGKPLICLDTTGYTRYFSNDYARVIPITDRADTIDRLATAMAELTEPAIRRQLGTAAASAAPNFDWSHKGSQIAQILTQKLNI